MNKSKLLKLRLDGIFAFVFWFISLLLIIALPLYLNSIHKLQEVVQFFKDLSSGNSGSGSKPQWPSDISAAQTAIMLGFTIGFLLIHFLGFIFAFIGVIRAFDTSKHATAVISLIGILGHPLFLIIGVIMMIVALPVQNIESNSSDGKIVKEKIIIKQSSDGNADEVSKEILENAKEQLNQIKKEILDKQNN